MRPRVLIAGAGNIFHADDGFGVEVAQRLARRPLPPGVAVRDFGIRGFDLALELIAPYQAVVLVDACARGAPPGTVSLVEPDAPPPASAAFDAHTLHPLAVMRLARSLGAPVARVLLVACEPARLEPADDGDCGLSPPVAAAVPVAIDMIVGLVERLAAESRAAPAARGGPASATYRDDLET